MARRGIMVGPAVATKPQLMLHLKSTKHDNKSLKLHKNEADADILFAHTRLALLPHGRLRSA